MVKIVDVKRANFFKKLADRCMVPIMYLVSGTFKERPQSTHVWNVQTLTKEAYKYLPGLGMLECKGIPRQLRKRYLVLFHIPVLGGWKNFVVMEPVDYSGVWHVGWAHDGVAQISTLPNNGPIRMLIGPDDVSFFGVTDDGIHVRVHAIGSGRIGCSKEFSKIPLC